MKIFHVKNIIELDKSKRLIKIIDNYQALNVRFYYLDMTFDYKF